MSVRTRIAPSPTGDPHVGTAYVALFNYALARKQGGQFLLRIEDTDRQRSTPEAVTAIVDGLAWLELGWDGDIVSTTVSSMRSPRSATSAAIEREKSSRRFASWPCPAP